MSKKIKPKRLTFIRYPDPANRKNEIGLHVILNKKTTWKQIEEIRQDYLRNGWEDHTRKAK